MLRAVLGEVEHSPGVNRPFALLPALGRSTLGAVDAWLLVLLSATMFPEFLGSLGEVGSLLGVLSDQCACAFIYEQRPPPPCPELSPIRGWPPRGPALFRK